MTAVFPQATHGDIDLRAQGGHLRPEPNFQVAKFINGINNLAAHLDTRTALTALTVLTH